jgi:guanosine-3',5'-bis(diphosphate) 3'-pyrophosphohydrolase
MKIADIIMERVEERTAIEDIETKLSVARQFIQQLAPHHSKVMDQFDSFACNIKQAYISGEGLIHKDINRMIDGVVFAADKHQFQVRQDEDQTPYIIHPIGVANHLFTIGRVRDPDIIIGALLHDTVEDTQTTFEEIEQRFGSRIAHFVLEVTDDKTLPPQKRKQLQVDHAPEKSAGAAQIKLADKLYNLSDLMNSPPVGWSEERIDCYFRWAKNVVDNLPWVNAPLLQALHKVFEEYRSAKLVTHE